MNRVVVALLGAGLAGFGRAETVRVGYFSEPQPFVAGIAREWFDTADDDFAFFNQQSGYWVNAKLDQGDLDIAFLGSNPFAVGAARGVDSVLFYVQYVIGDSEALVMRSDGVESPLDLEGKTVGVPFGSTTHYHLAYTATLNPSVSFEQVNLQPGEIIAQYDAGAIDGAFIWDAGVDAKNHIIDHGGFQLLSSGLYETWGKPTSMVCVVSRRFLERRPDLVERFAGVYGRLDAAFDDQRGVCDSADAALWDPASEESLLASIALAHAGVNDAETRLDFKTKMEQNYLFRPPATQLTCDFLGDGSGCDAGFGPTIEAHAEFNFDMKELTAPVPSSSDLSSAAFYASNVDATFLLNGLAAAPTLDELVALGRPVAPASAGSANRGDSTCGAATLAGSGTADDGAGGRPGASYSNGLACSWTISGSGVAQVDFDVLKVWAGDAVSVYGGDAATGVLLARLSGLGAKAWPVFRYPGTITVLFETDGLDDGAFGKDFADGVSFAYDADAPPCGACGGHGACGGDGLCVCDAGYFGGDCSFSDHCLGHVAPSDAPAGTFKSGADALESGAAYGARSACRFAVQASPGDWVRFDVDYDVEDSYDYVTISGAAGSDVALTGRGAAVVAVPVDGDGLATLSFDSDDFGQRGGFVADWTVGSAACASDGDCVHGDCVAGTCDCEDGWAGHACSLDFCLPSNPYVAAARGFAYSQPPGVEAVPRNADCAWSAGLADPTNERAGTRLYFDAFDVERFEKTAGGTYDAVTVSRPDGAVVAGPLSLLRCRADYECDEKWMSGACVDDDRAPGLKYCAVKRTWELDTEDDLRIGFASDRNDIGAGGSPAFAGLQLHWYAVDRCPSSDLCLDLGGVCVDGECYCGGAQGEGACDCSCEPTGCAAGSFLDEADGTYLGCTPCPPGSELSEAQLAEGLRTCQPCDVGYYAPDAGSHKCEPCAAGSYATDDPRDADGIGTHPFTGAVACLPCPAGTYSENATSFSCSACDVVPGGYYSDPGSTVCDICLEDYYYKPFSDPLPEDCGGTGLLPEGWCRPGGDRRGRPDGLCVDCADEFGSSEADCPQGTVIETVDVKKNFYRHLNVDTAIKPCPWPGACDGGEYCEERMAAGLAANCTESGDDLCAKGYFGRACARCWNEDKGREMLKKPKAYHLVVPGMICERCEAAGKLRETITIVVIVVVAVLVFAVTAFFSRVPTSVEDVKKKLFKAMAVADVPLVDKTVSEILPHPADAAFAGQRPLSPAERHTVSKGLRVSGTTETKITFASSQSRDFSSGSVGLDAAPSADGEDSTTAGSPALSKHAVSARRVLDAAKRPKLDRGMSLRSLKLDIFRGLADGLNKEASLQEVLESDPDARSIHESENPVAAFRDYVLTNGLNNLKRSISDAMVILYYRLKIKWRMVVTAMQIISSTTSSFDLPWPPAFEALLKFFRIFMLDFSVILPLDCLRETSYYTSLYATCLGPFALVFAYFAFAFVANKYTRRTAQRRDSLERQGTSALSVAECATPPTEARKQREMKPGLKFSYVAGVVFVWFFVFPACSATALAFWRCEGGWGDGHTYLLADLKLRCGGERYATNQIFAALMVVVWPVGTPLLFFGLMYRVRYRVNPYGAYIEKMDKAEFNARTKVVTEADLVVEQYKMLWLAYKYELWHFEVAVVVQRLLLTCITELVYPGTQMNIIFAIIVVLLSLKVFTYYEPYMDVTDNDLTEIFHWVFIWLFISALIMTCKLNKLVIDVALMASLLAGLGTITYMMIYEVHREKKAIQSAKKLVRRWLSRWGLARPPRLDDSYTERDPVAFDRKRSLAASSSVSFSDAPTPRASDRPPDFAEADGEA